MTNDLIDIVVTWVDGTDETWLKEKSQYSPKTTYSTADTKNRYAPSALFKYWFRGIETFAPWVNKVFFVTYGHIPEWLDSSHPKLRIIKHTDYIPHEYLPTYNSNVIEMHLHRIEDLSERFILFSDDVFLINHVRPTDFFVDTKVKDIAVYKPILPKESFNHVEVNNTIIMNKYFKEKKQIKKYPWKFFRLRNGKYNINNFFSLLYPAIMGYKTGHLSQPHLKSTFEEIWEKESVLLSEVSHNRFRQETDCSHYLMAHWNIESGKFIPQDSNFGKYFSNQQITDIEQAIKKQSFKVICINDDTELDGRIAEEKLVVVFEQLLTNKSTYEL